MQAVSEESDLRALKRAEIKVGDVADQLGVGVPRRSRELFPVRVRRELRPVNRELGDVRKREHVGQAWHVGAIEGVREENGIEAGALEYRNLGLVKHLDLVGVGYLAGAFVCPELKDAVWKLARDRFGRS